MSKAALVLALKCDRPKYNCILEEMPEETIDALVLRLPENVTYLSGAWCGRGLTYLIFPLEKDPVLIHPAGDTLPLGFLMSDSTNGRPSSTSGIRLILERLC
jgi:Xaa-Pro aminopeptidase